LRWMSCQESFDIPRMDGYPEAPAKSFISQGRAGQYIVFAAREKGVGG
jgi:hypothetical protein